MKVTKEGLLKLKTELVELQDVKRPKLVERLANARAQGDLSENSDYQSAREELEFLDGRIDELTEAIKGAVINIKSGVSDVSLGTSVTVKTANDKVTFQIVGEWEADPVSKKISHTSPLGAALLGKKIGDRVDVEAPAGRVTYEILAIS